MKRRQFLKAVLVGAGAAASAGCSPLIDRAVQPALPPDVARADDAVWHLMQRATFGPRPGLGDEIRAMGVEAWIEQQLRPFEIDDTATDLRLRRYDSLPMLARDLRAYGRLPDKRLVMDELVNATVIRQVYSQRHLHEVMVNFWSDHFSIYHEKEGVRRLKTVDDREVIRPHALGTFRDLLTASAHSPAMLVYLDNVLNEKSHPNENYAREIMELHTLGVNGGYSEADVLEVARCFTGWSVGDNGAFEFKPDWHDDGAKTVLGQSIPAGGGKADGDRVLQILLDHPNTARYVSTKLVRRFVADDPPPQAVDACVTTWRETDGDIAAVLRTLLHHDAFWNAPPRLKRPLQYAVSTLRATNARVRGSAALLDWLERMGQRPFNWATPDGFPDVQSAWLGGLVQRWNFAIAAVNGDIEGVMIPLAALAAHDLPALLLNRPLSDAERAALPANPTPQDTLTTILTSPAFQWR